MTFLRLGVAAAVFDDKNRILLSQRADFGVWNLPGGRLDSGERLEQAAAREVLEETGIVAYIECPVGLYYSAGWGRLTVVYTGWSLGGQLLQHTHETKANRFFPTDQLPGELLRRERVRDALAETRPLPTTIVTPREEMRRMRRQLAWRWVRNLLGGTPEPRFPRFVVRTVGLVWDRSHLRVLALRGKREHILPSMNCNGRLAPWHDLTIMLRRYCDATLAFQWVGLWQDAAHDEIELVFAATSVEGDLSDGAEWITARNAAFSGRDADYIERVKTSYLYDPVWTINLDQSIEPVENFTVNERKSHGAG